MGLPRAGALPAGTRGREPKAERGALLVPSGYQGGRGRPGAGTLGVPKRDRAGLGGYSPTGLVSRRGQSRIEGEGGEEGRFG